MYERYPYHASYGYATEAEIKRLDEIGVCHEREKIMKGIEQRARRKKAEEKRLERERK